MREESNPRLGEKVDLTRYLGITTTVLTIIEPLKDTPEMIECTWTVSIAYKYLFTLQMFRCLQMIIAFIDVYTNQDGSLLSSVFSVSFRIKINNSSEVKAKLFQTHLEFTQTFFDNTV